MLDIFDTATISTFFSSFLTELEQPQFWVALTKIIWINILLSGDNALVIALACRGLEPRQRMWGMILGAGVAVGLRIIFTFIVASLLALPYLKLVGGIALLVIAAKLLVPEKHEEDNVQAAQHLWAAVKIVAVADIIMSLDNVIAVAAAANGSVVLLVLGLLISIPMIVAGAALIMALLDRLPALVWLGAALLGWVAGEVIATDPGVHPYLQRVLDGQIALNIDPTSAVFSLPSHMQVGTNLGELILGLLGVALVLVVGSMWRRRAMSEHAAVPVEATT
ncbi:integral membrane protein, YjbE family [Afipia felis]|jgi:YjbE family integral membrane protein|uniref:Integral membrane protein, YjbE family n=1 Tax=Afipia felis TaxID=1035 RepID=A0A090MLA5_AFIFE|nr:MULTISPECIES: YjbE family putative metal transport protein [Afipia]EFI51759.1 Integral membrane protein TerC [Afipia sp. 1NLS2]MBE0702175.1 YjbE family putative metal transport protein [Afipia sp.]RTL73461.1 MAG: TerC family protein [Bradyrhizobiaceae bacterium]CEG08245.1 integral membrane protein, YjbE family [Afipia felis]